MAGCESIRLKFKYDEKNYSAIFYIDQSLCARCKSKNNDTGILGANFIKKAKPAAHDVKPKE